LSGADLAERAVLQARRFGAEILEPQEVVGLRLEGPYRIVKLADGSEINGRTLLIATGVSYRPLDVPGVARLTGAGIYYGAAMTEALDCRDNSVYIVGGANSAGQAALYLSSFARNVTILIRGASLEAGMSHYLVDRITSAPNIHVRVNTQVREAHGESHLSALTLSDDAAGTTETVPTTALFVFIGAAPRTEWLGDLVERDENGFILAGPRLLHDGQPPANWPLRRDPMLLETSVPGIFVAGDVRSGSVKRVASSVGEGSMAVQLIHQALAELH
jgi:thioredoxin reductase (NADPH)